MIKEKKIVKMFEEEAQVTQKEQELIQKVIIEFSENLLKLVDEKFSTRNEKMRFINYIIINIFGNLTMQTMPPNANFKVLEDVVNEKITNQLNWFSKVIGYHAKLKEVH